MFWKDNIQKKINVLIFTPLVNKASVSLKYLLYIYIYIYIRNTLGKNELVEDKYTILDDSTCYLRISQNKLEMFEGRSPLLTHLTIKKKYFALMDPVLSHLWTGPSLPNLVMSPKMFIILFT